MDKKIIHINGKKYLKETKTKYNEVRFRGGVENILNKNLISEFAYILKKK